MIAPNDAAPCAQAGDDSRGQTLTEIGATLGLMRARIQQWVDLLQPPETRP